MPCPVQPSGRFVLRTDVQYATIPCPVLTYGMLLPGEAYRATGELRYLPTRTLCSTPVYARALYRKSVRYGTNVTSA
eukprot:3157266-Rhodomonas_salina.1